MVIITAHNTILIQSGFLGAGLKEGQKEIHFHMNSLTQDVLKPKNINK